MAPIRCCGFGGSRSPEPGPVRLVDSSQGRGRFALSSTASSAEGSDVPPIREIFASAEKDEGCYETPTGAALEIGIHRKESSRRLHEAASKIRKRMSRDSSISRRSSKQRLSTSKSTEDVDRRSELKRALHRRVQSDLIEDPTASDNMYDDDAMPIKTPKTTWGRHEGSIQISPKHLSKALAKSRSHSGLHSSYVKLSQRGLSQVYAPNDTAVALSRMLTQRASNLTGESEDEFANTVSEGPKRTRTTKKYVFEEKEEETPNKYPGIRTPSPITRANTVIHVTSSNKVLDGGFKNPPFPNIVRTPSSPDLLPPRLVSITDPEANGDQFVSFSEKSKAALQVPLSNSHTASVISSRQPVIYDTKIRPASEQWLHGALGVRSPKSYSKQTTHWRSQDDSKNVHHCDPPSEERTFGGIDGDDDSPSDSVYYNARTRASSEGNEPGHLYNIHVPKRLISKSLLPSASQPQLQEPRRDRSYTSGDSSALFSVVPRRQASSDVISKKVPLAWNNHRPRAASSVYSSQPESLLSSRRDSLVQVTSLSDRVQQFRDCQVSEDIISAPANGKPVNINRLERQTNDTSFHSSNESLTNRELAAAERRISTVHRTNTLPKDSRFVEDLEQISAEIRSTNPPRRRFSNLDGSGDLRTPSIYSPRSLSRLSVNNEATSVSEKAAREHARLSISSSRSLRRLSINDQGSSAWERALREHYREDTTLQHTRLGSYSPDLLGPTDVDPKSKAPSRRPSTQPSLYRNQDHLSVEADRGLQLQARLAAYKMPTYHSLPKKRPSVNEAKQAKRSSSAYPIGSWARYPSHSRSERSASPAGIEDQVFARDFADTTPKSSSSKRQDSKLDPSKRKKSMNFGKHILSQLSRLYKSQSQDLQRKLANEARGHRSSISEGGMLEYPELELLGRVSPPLPSPDITIKRAMEELFKSESQQAMQTGEDAKNWSRLYEDCVVPPTPTEFGASPVGSFITSPIGSFVGSPVGSPNRMSEVIGPKDVHSRGGDGTRDVNTCGGGTKASRATSQSSNLRASTVDFKMSLELEEGLARERMLEFMERMST